MVTSVAYWDHTDRIVRHVIIQTVFGDDCAKCEKNEGDEQPGMSCVRVLWVNLSARRDPLCCAVPGACVTERSIMRNN